MTQASRFLCLSAALLFVIALHAQKTIRVSALDLSKSFQQYGTIIKGKTVTNEPAIIDGKTYEDVIGVQAKSSIRIDLNKNASNFTARAGVTRSGSIPKQSELTTIPLTDGTKIIYNTKNGGKSFVGVEGKNGNIEKGSVYFIVRGDGKELYKTAIMQAKDEPATINISVKGIRLLELLVEPTEDGPSGDHAAWIDAQLTYSEIIPATVEPDFTEEGPEMLPQTQKKLREKINRLPKISIPLKETGFDWLIHKNRARAGIYATQDGMGIVIANEMIAREFRVFPNLATVDITNRMTGESLLRAVSSEGSIQIDGKWVLGGLGGQPELGYLKREWLQKMKTTPGSLIVSDIETGPIDLPIAWKPNRWALNKNLPTGKRITFLLEGKDELKGLNVKLHYDIFDHIPVIRKSLELQNSTAVLINIDAFQLENLAFSDVESPVGGDPADFRLPNIHIESDYACGGGFTEKETDLTEKWVADPRYTSQRNYPMQTPCILEVAPPLGPDQTLQPGQTFRSFNVYEMPFDSDDRERKGLFKRRLHYTLAPWATQNPIFMHLTSSDPRVIRTAVDQCAETGYEMIIISFGSGLNAEDTSAENIHKWKTLVDYAKSKGIEMGCYSLLSSRWISEEVDVINPATGKRGGMIFGSSPCLSSDWGYAYFEKIKTFIEKTGMSCFEHDGSYPGNVCASTSHEHHKGLDDSQWNQFYKITGLYEWMCKNGIYINVPDFYFLNGSTKVGIGYREANWSLPRDRQLIHSRQLNYDGTWDRMASACWSFVPLVEYQGGGKEATLEPLSEHLFEYKTHMMQNYGAGVQACYRGPRLYDTEETKAAVREVISWYKKYRNILNSDIIHLRRPDAKDWDGLMHVNPAEKQKALAMFFNPTEKPVTRSIELPLYYTGLSKQVKLREKEGKSVVYTLDRNYNISLNITIPANGYTWYVVE